MVIRLLTIARLSQAPGTATCAAREGWNVAGGSAEGEVNHWPAFVDVLTTVIMVVTFLLVIMSAAVMVLSQRAVERFKANYDAQHQKVGEAPKVPAGATAADANRHARLRSPADAPDGSSIAELGDVLKSDTAVDGQDRLSIRTRETPETLRLAVKADEQPDDTKGVKVETADVLLRLDFDPMAVRLDADTEGKVKTFVAGKADGGATYEIWSSAPQSMSVTEAQRLAFYRAAMVRNVLIRAGIAGAKIRTQVRVTDPTSKDGHNVRVVVKP